MATGGPLSGGPLGVYIQPIGSQQVFIIIRYHLLKLFTYHCHNAVSFKYTRAIHFLMCSPRVILLRTSNAVRSFIRHTT